MMADTEMNSEAAPKWAGLNIRDIIGSKINGITNAMDFPDINVATA
jgi:hypothetical protein